MHAAQQAICGRPVITELMGGSPAERPDRYRLCYHVRGQRLVSRAPNEPEWPVPLTAEEQAIGLAGLRRRYLGSVLQEIVGGSNLPAELVAPALDLGTREAQEIA